MTEAVDIDVQRKGDGYLILRLSGKYTSKRATCRLAGLAAVSCIGSSGL